MEILRIDRIELHPEATVNHEDFVKFMKEELFPFFVERYGSATRITLATIRNQSLLKETGDERKYLWVTEWSGRGEDVGGQFFERVVMKDEPLEERKAVLEKIESFGKRTPEVVLAESL
jgi:hypothetical protein